jgi:hypothetical protein
MLNYNIISVDLVVAERIILKRIKDIGCKVASGLIRPRAGWSSTVKNPKAAP